MDISKGTWEVDPLNKKDVIVRRARDGFIFMRIPCKREANTTLVAQAGNVANSTGLMPDELVDLLKRALPFISHLAARDNVDAVCILRTEIKQALTKGGE
ncbi:hypothetical protein LCGC14_1606180 [marine sediment metagenome]|uniref:Uncharacterized protein n=1 Tax=marine sediment metagenome TaxID=412755 RepID=A0A0F9I9P5_9ZZZZ|nr:hypothetical protein [Methylophaga sp.]